jgi:hypothetical protein
MATTKQNQMIAGRMVEFQDRFSPLPNDDAQWLIQNTGEAIDLIVSAIVNRVKSVAQAVVIILSEIIATVTIPATTEKFVAKDKFKVDTGRKAKVKISYIGDNFKSWFMGKTEEPFAGSTVYGRKLNKGSVDGPILAELGGQEKAETTLSELFAMMERQANGESGELLTNGYANIFYVRDIDGTLRAVDVYWRGGGWYVDADSVGHPFGWRAVRCVFSRNSSVPQTV